jgi:hypothetical protein
MNENTEELIFKGMRQLRYKRQDVMLRDALRSPYYWWWAFLRLSKDYWWVCRRRGAVGDQRLKGMYRDFGNVYELTFEEWFLKRGKNLLREELALPEVRKLSPSNLELSQPVERHLILEIPLNMTEKNIISQVRRQLRIHPEREVERISTAKRKLAKLIGIRQDVIESAYAVWKLHYESRDGRAIEKIGQMHGTKSLYQIGKELRLVRSCMPVATDNQERAAKRVNGMKVAVSRMLTRANNLIENAAIGVFPSIQPIKNEIEYSTTQVIRMFEDVADGWRPLFDPNDKLIVHERDDVKKQIGETNIKPTAQQP